MAADGTPSKDIAAKLGVSRPTVQLWRDRFAQQGLAGIEKTLPGRAARRMDMQRSSSQEGSREAGSAPTCEGR